MEYILYYHHIVLLMDDFKLNITGKSSYLGVAQPTVGEHEAFLTEQTICTYTCIYYVFPDNIS